MKILINFGILFTLVLFLLVAKTYAGGCCYKFFTSTDGIAEVKDAQISTGFVDPTSYNPFSNRKIEIHVLSAKPGQFCRTNSEKTNDQGNLEAHCSSPFPGSLTVYFSSPEVSVQENETIRSVPKSINFAVNPNAHPTGEPMPTSVPFPTNILISSAIEPRPTLSTEMPIDTGSEAAILKKQLQDLQDKVAAQQQQINSLQKMINSFIDFLKSIFH